MAYWYNVETHQVEESGNTHPKEHLMGPYNTVEEAQSALARNAEINKKWDEEDREWAGDDEDADS